MLIVNCNINYDILSVKVVIALIKFKRVEIFSIKYYPFVSVIFTSI